MTKGKKGNAKPLSPRARKKLREQNSGFGRLYHSAMELLKNVSPTAQRVYCLSLLKRANWKPTSKKYGTCWPSRKIICRDTGRNWDAVQKGIKELEEHGLILYEVNKHRDNHTGKFFYKRLFTIVDYISGDRDSGGKHFVIRGKNEWADRLIDIYRREVLEIDVYGNFGSCHSYHVQNQREYDDFKEVARRFKALVDCCNRGWGDGIEIRSFHDEMLKYVRWTKGYASALKNKDVLSCHLNSRKWLQSYLLRDLLKRFPGDEPCVYKVFEFLRTPSESPVIENNDR